MRTICHRSSSRCLLASVVAVVLLLSPVHLLAAPLTADQFDDKVTALDIVPFDGGDFVVPQDESKQFMAVAVFSDGRREYATDRVVFATSDIATAAVMADGRVLGKQPGEVSLTATDVTHNIATTVRLAIWNQPKRVFLKAPNYWQQANLWAWYLRGSADPSGIDENGQPLGFVSPAGFSAWPGPLMTATPTAKGWFSYDIPRYDSLELRDEKLRKQPIWVVFNNPVTGEKTSDYLRDGGCFYADSSSKDGKLSGSWRSLEQCEQVSSGPLTVVAEPAGGPFWSPDGVEVHIKAKGANLAACKYAIDKTVNAASGEVGSCGATDKVIKLGANLTDQQAVTLCLMATDTKGGAKEQCFTYHKNAEIPAATRLGVTYSPQQSTFLVWSPGHADVRLWLDGRVLPMGYLGDRIAGYQDVYGITVAGDFQLKPYHFMIAGKSVRDPYAVMVEPGTDFNIVMNMSLTGPTDGWVMAPPLVRRDDAVIYELGVRDFTISASSGLPLALRGTFRGLVTPGARLVDDDGSPNAQIKTGLDHLKELGVTHVQILPMYDYGTCSAKDPYNSPSCYNWGYDPENFNVPEERYASVQQTAYVERVNELKTMVNELHKAGIRVIMDVVYNHTWTRSFRDQDEGERYFSQITDGYFLHDKFGRAIDLTGTGNTIDSAAPMVKRYIRDSLEYWVREYHVDGFRFDLAGVYSKYDMRDWQIYLEESFPGRNLLLYGEPWVANALADTNGNHIRLQNLGSMLTSGDREVHFGAFNDALRNALKGDGDSGGGGGFVFNDHNRIWAVAHGTRGSVVYGDGKIEASESIFAMAPDQTINYVSSHDNLTLWDKIDLWSEASGVKDVEYKKRIQEFAIGIILTAQGLPLIQGGDEFARTKYRNHNSYKSPDHFNQFDWTRKRVFWSVFDYYRNAIATRKAHGSLRLATRDEINQSVSVDALDKDKGYFVLHIKPGVQNTEEVLLIYNAGSPLGYALPDGEWQVAMRDGKVLTPLHEDKVTGVIRVDGTAVTMLFRSF